MDMVENPTESVAGKKAICKQLLNVFKTILPQWELPGSHFPLPWAFIWHQTGQCLLLAKSLIASSWVPAVGKVTSGSY